MSDLRPSGIPVVLDGVERHFLFTMNIIDEIQDRYGKTLHEVIADLAKADGTEHTLRDLVVILLNDEAQRMAKNPGEASMYPVVTEMEVGEMIGLDNYYTVMAAVLRAYGISLPEPEEEDDPNRKSGQTNR